MFPSFPTACPPHFSFFDSCSRIGKSDRRRKVEKDHSTRREVSLRKWKDDKRSWEDGEGGMTEIENVTKK